MKATRNDIAAMFVQLEEAISADVRHDDMTFDAQDEYDAIGASLTKLRDRYAALVADPRSFG